MTEQHQRCCETQISGVTRGKGTFGAISPLTSHQFFCMHVYIHENELEVSVMLTIRSGVSHQQLS